LNEEIEDDISSRNMDCGKIKKRKKMSASSLENLAGNKERQADEAREVWVRLT
jgi:hypothetical protein